MTDCTGFAADRGAAALLPCVLLAPLVLLSACGGEGDGALDRDAGDGGTAMAGDGAVDSGGDAHCECDNGTCVDILDDTGTERTVCECDPGFAGEQCDICAPSHSGERCDSCADGFVESEEVPGLCEPAPCEGVDCSGRGTCYTDVTATGIVVARCECESPFQGDICELCEPGYEGDDCGTCSAGYTMQDGECVEDACVDVHCGDHGTCSGGTCECDEGYALPTCDGCEAGYVPSGGECVPDGCAELECDHGACVVTLAGPACDCERGWAPPACDECLPGYFPHTEDGITECVNELPVRDRRLERSYDAMAPWTIVADTMGYVDEWHERYGTTRLVTAGGTTRPRQTILPAGVQYDGENDGLWTTATSLIADGESFAVFMVVSWDPEGGRQTLLDSQMPIHDYVESYSLDALDANTVRFRLHDLVSPMADVVTSHDFDATAGRQLVVVEREPFLTGHVFRVSNGTDTTTIEATNGPVAEGAWGIVGRCREIGPTPDCYLDGSIHELVVYDGDLTADERDDVIAYLRAKWSL